MELKEKFIVSAKDYHEFNEVLLVLNHALKSGKMDFKEVGYVDDCYKAVFYQKNKPVSQSQLVTLLLEEHKNEFSNLNDVKAYFQDHDLTFKEEDLNKGIESITDFYKKPKAKKKM